MKKLYAIVVGLFLLGGCQATTERLGNAPFTISEVYPSAVLPGTQVLIRGENFPKSSIVVRFGDTTADTLQRVSKTLIKALVPATASNDKKRRVALSIESNDNQLHSNQVVLTLLPTPQNVPALFWAAQGISQGSITAKGQLITQQLYNTPFARGLVVDNLAREIYWGNYAGAVFRASLDRPQDSTQLFQLSEGLQDFVLDKNKEWLYYCTQTEIKRRSLSDSTRHETLYVERVAPNSLKISSNNNLYWCELDVNSLFKAHPDRDPKPIPWYRMGQGVEFPASIALDEQQDRIYITETSVDGACRIVSGTLSRPSAVRELYRGEDGIGANVVSIALDKTHNYLYWMNGVGSAGEKMGDIRRGSTDGKTKPEVVIQPIDMGYMLAL